MNRKITALSAFIALLTAPVLAQTNANVPVQGEVVTMIGDNSALPSEVYTILLENAPVNPQYKNLPRFAIIGKDKKFYLGMGATIKATASFDWGNPLADPSLFITSALTEAAPGNGGLFQMTAKQSQLYFNFVVLPGSKHQIGAYIDVIFAGNNNEYGVMLSNAYMKYRGFTAGYKFTMYCDLAALPFMIDTEGPNSSAANRNTVLNYEHNFTKAVKAGVGFELPMISLTNTNNTIVPVGTTDVVSVTKNVTQRIPDIPLYVQYKWNQTGNGHIRLATVLRNLQYRDVNSGENKTNFAWGAKLSSIAQFGNLTTYFVGQYGKGIGSYLQDNTGLGLDMVPSATNLGELTNTTSWGAYAALQYNFSKKVFTTVVYSHLRNYMDSYTGGNLSYDGQYQWGQYALANLIWNITPQVQTGVEYLYGRRTNFDQAQVHDNRISALLQVSF